MFSILAKTFRAASRRDLYPTQHADHHRSHPMTTWEEERLEADRRRAAMRNVGMW